MLAVLLTGIIAAQLFLAGAGAGSSAPRERSCRPHHALGPVVFSLPLVTAAFAMIARMPRRLSVLLVSIAAMTALQVVLAKVAQSLRLNRLWRGRSFTRPPSSRHQPRPALTSREAAGSPSGHEWVPCRLGAAAVRRWRSWTAHR